MVAGHKIAITDPEKATVFLVKESGEKAEIQKNGDVYEVEVSALSTNNKKEEQILIQSEDNTYTIHTRPETMANLTTYVDKNKVEKGAYTFAVDHYLIRVNTEGKIIYYRNMDCTGEKTGKELQVENFRAQDGSEDKKRYYTYFVELDPTKRNMNGGYSSGMYVIMDQNYKEINYVILQKNVAEHHVHGEGYLDQYELNLLSKDHWFALSYTELHVKNIPKTVPTKYGK